ncbi:MAG TPA: hypothetical protein VII72_09995 [Myxococcota bacterium]|jgi:hypothetical protein
MPRVPIPRVPIPRAGLVAILCLLAAPASAATPGFVEDFSAGTGGFGGGSAVAQVGSGGVGGAADPYLTISNAAVGNLGAFSQGADLVGNLPADGVTGYTFWLRDTGADDALEIHVGIGTLSNFWLSFGGFMPPTGSWQQFAVDLGNQNQWVQIIGTGTFQSALASSNRILFRHDVPPLVQNPNPIAADFGLDRIQVLPAPSAAAPAISAAGRAALGVLLCAAVALELHRRTARSRAPSA